MGFDGYSFGFRLTPQLIDRIQELRVDLLLLRCASFLFLTEALLVRRLGIHLPGWLWRDCGQRNGKRENYE
jgi:hypothetical protein